MSAPAPEAPPRRALLQRAAAALAAAVALGLAALLLGERVAPDAGAAREDVGEAPAAHVAAPPPELGDSAATPPAGNTPMTASRSAPAADAAAPEALAPETGASATAAAAAQPLRGVLIPEAASAASAPGHRIQLGVFGDPANAVQLYERVAGAGYEVRIQSRVVVGPFADKSEAERAQRALRELGVAPGVVIPPPRPR